MVVARKDKHSLPVFLERFGLSKSSYYYQETAMRREDKYDGVRRRISEIIWAEADAGSLFLREGVIPEAQKVFFQPAGTVWMVLPVRKESYTGVSI